ncbi:hypothetical protein HPP92_021966 [Vanilla planifolia]|uniref:Uncharacterized protein n=1 Tax=Vanilla planifolia TaxID=51239 RepID=A0A835PXB1_VANPL|nr:hypothetical protein HPP92_021966 [Vanilla planifolia]
MQQILNVAFAAGCRPAIGCSTNYDQEGQGLRVLPLTSTSPVLNLYFLDSGDYSTVPSIPGCGWIKPSQQVWFQKTSSQVELLPQKDPTPGLVYFHIPLPEFVDFDSTNFTGVKQEGISSASTTQVSFATMVEAGDVKAVFTGHDHLNDFCGKLTGIQLCYAVVLDTMLMGKLVGRGGLGLLEAYLERMLMEKGRVRNLSRHGKTS